MFGRILSDQWDKIYNTVVLGKLLVKIKRTPKLAIGPKDEAYIFFSHRQGIKQKTTHGIEIRKAKKVQNLAFYSDRYAIYGYICMHANVY